MNALSQTKTNTAEGFVGSVFKYSISTFVNMGIMGLAILLTGRLLAPEHHNQMNLFISNTQTIMTITILGMDQALIRFYHEAPSRLDRSGLFRICYFFSSAVLLVAGIIGSTMLSQTLYSLIGFSSGGRATLPLLFLNAFFYMTARYFNVLYRMEGNIAVYTVQSICMQFFYRLFYFSGLFFGGQNPVPAMVLCSVGGLGVFALVFSFMRRKVLRPRPAEFTSGAYRTVVPYAFSIAPTAIIILLNNSVVNSYLTHTVGDKLAGSYGFAFQLSNIVTMVQLGFASFWGPYMFENYKTQQPRIKQVHDYINFIILSFFAVLVAMQDLLFFIFPKYQLAQPIFPLMMLAAVFTILCETTVYGNAIARRPVLDTLGFALSFAVCMALCVTLAPRFGLYGAATALACGNLAMFLFRTLTAQKLYSSIENPVRTAVAVALGMVLAVLGTVFAGNLPVRLGAAALWVGIYCLIYRRQLVDLWRLALRMLQGFLLHTANKKPPL